MSLLRVVDNAPPPFWHPVKRYRRKKQVALFQKFVDATVEEEGLSAGVRQAVADLFLYGEATPWRGKDE